MAMLSRYQKPGGFLQLLKIIETCGKQKQENFINLVQNEDSRWADALRMKMLTVEKILSWENEPLAEIASRLKEVTLATVLHGLTEEQWQKLSSTFSHSQKRKVEDLKNEKKPTDAELTSAYLKLIEEVRILIIEGYIRIEKFAPDLVIEDKIEEKLKNAEFTPSAPAAQTEASTSLDLDGFGSTPPSGETAFPDVAQMVMKLKNLQKENQVLKNENKVLKERLGNIRKMAA